MKFFSLKNAFTERREYFLLSMISLLSLLILGVKLLFINSLVMGFIFAPIYLLFVSFLCGNAFFPQGSLRFRVFYGFVIFYCLLVVLGYIAYFIHDLSNFPILAILFLLTISLIYMNRDRQLLPSLASIKLRETMAGLNLGSLDLLFLSMVGLSFYFLFAARTGESIPPIWSIVSGRFFVCVLLATVFLLLKIWHGKSPSGLLLFYIILLILIPACGFLIVTKHPYDMKNAFGLESDWKVTEFGRFVTNPAHPEEATSLIGKSILEKGQSTGDVFLIKLFQLPPLKFALFFIPILFTFVTVLASFGLMRSIAPNQKGLALLCSLSFLATQHNIFLFTPPGKNESFALGILLVNVMLWVKFLLEQRFSWASFLAPVLLTAAILLIHQFVGLFALFLALSVLTFFWLKPLEGGLSHLLLWIGLSLCSMLIWVYGYPYLLFLSTYLTGTQVGGIVSINQLTLARFIGTIAPPLWSKEGLGVFQGIFYGFTNNSVYVTYTLIILGAIAAFIYRLNKNWLAITLSLIVLAFGYFAAVGNFHEFRETYRFFYYFNFLAFPLMGVGLYWIASYVVELKAWIYTKLKEKERFLSLKPLQLAISGLLLASLFTSSVWAGYPRPDSMGPYHYPSWVLWYPSDYDFAALDFIKAREGEEPYKDFFIVGDHPTSAAGMLTLKSQVISTDEGYVSIYTFFIGRFGWEEFFNLAAYEPIRYLVEGTDYTNRLAERTYLVFTYRLGIERLKSVVNVYSGYLGKPVYSIEGKIYVFSYDRQQIADLFSKEVEEQLILFDDEQVKDGFWIIERSGTGNLSVTIGDSYDTKKRGNSSLEVTTTQGTHGYIALIHIWKNPINLGDGEYLLLFAYGHNSGRKFNISFRSATPKDYFLYTITDNFEGWKLLAIPLEGFVPSGNASWSLVTQVLIQFFGGNWLPGKQLYLDQISIVKQLPLQLCYQEALMILR